MTITANGKTFDLDPGRSLRSFLESIGHEPGLVVVERNEEAIAPSEAETTVLNDGDRLEIVRIVAGG